MLAVFAEIIGGALPSHQVAKVSFLMENIDPSALVLSVSMNPGRGRLDPSGRSTCFRSRRSLGVRQTLRSRAIFDASANGLRSVLCFRHRSEIYLRDHGLPGLRCDEVDCFG